MIPTVYLRFIYRPPEPPRGAGTQAGEVDMPRDPGVDRDVPQPPVVLEGGRVPPVSRARRKLSV